jgi:hypothetical protein
MEHHRDLLLVGRQVSLLITLDLLPRVDRSPRIIILQQ